MFKAVISDLDGTLLNAEHQISPRTRGVLRDLSEQGRDVILASGRAYVDMAFLRDQLGFSMYLISSNGAQIFDPAGAMLSQQSIAPDVVAGVLALARRHPAVHTNMYQNTDWLVEQAKPELLAFHESGFSYKVCDLSAAAALDGCIKLFFIAPHDTLLPLEQELQQQFGDCLEITYSLPHCMEVMRCGVNKGQALTKVLELLSRSPEQAIAFGDGLNDIEMLSLVGRGLVMDNASARVKAALPSHEVINSHCQDGVAQYLQQHLLS